MIFIATALYCEAKALIEKYALKKDASNTRFQVFSDDEGEMLLMITGAGSIAAASVVSGVCAQYSGGRKTPAGHRIKKDEDFLINIGVCSGRQPEGSVYICNKLTELATGRTFYPDMLCRHGFREAQITTVMKPFGKEKDSGDKKDTDQSNTVKSFDDERKSDKKESLIDMEAAAVYQAGAYFFGPHQMSFIKIVSDNASPEAVTEKRAAELIKKNIEVIAEYIDTLKKASRQFNKNKDILDDDGNREWVDRLCEDMHCSAAMRAAVEQYIRYRLLEDKKDCLINKSRLAESGEDKNIRGTEYKSYCLETVRKMYDKNLLPCADKREGKRCFEELKRELL